MIKRQQRLRRIERAKKGKMSTCQQEHVIQTNCSSQTNSHFSKQMTLNRIEAVTISQKHLSNPAKRQNYLYFSKKMSLNSIKAVNNFQFRHFRYKVMYASLHSCLPPQSMLFIFRNSMPSLKPWHKVGSFKKTPECKEKASLAQMNN